MKKVSLLFAVLALVSVSAFADNRWSEPDFGSYPDRFVVYTQLFINGRQHIGQFDAEIAAFVDDECRADLVGKADRNGFYALQVWGSEEDNGKPVVIKVALDGLVYQFKSTLKYEYQATYASVPYILNLDAITASEFPETTTITQAPGTTYDILKDIKFLYYDIEGNEYSPKGDSFIDEEETPLSYTWDFENSRDFLYIDENNNIVVVDECNEAYLGLYISAGDYRWCVKAYTLVTIEFPSVPVTSISANPTSITVSTGDNVLQALEQKVGVTVLPVNADNKGYSFIVSAAASNFFPDNIASTPGEYIWYVVSDYDPNIKSEITVIVSAPVRFSSDEVVDLSLITQGKAKISNVTGSGFTPSLITVDVSPAIATAVVDTKNLVVTFTGKEIGTGRYTLLYNGNSICGGTLNVAGEIQLSDGWNWIGNYTSVPYSLTSDGGYDPGLFSIGADHIVEVRSQTSLLYNDPKTGPFGDITELTSGVMYKVKASCQETLSINLGVSKLLSGVVDINTAGYTWITYPVIGNHTFNYINSNSLLSEAAEGDAIIGKSGFAEFDGVRWVASAGFRLETGAGYIYFQEAGTRKSLDFGKNYVREDALASFGVPSRTVNPWAVTPVSYSDNMAVVARIDGVEAGDNYSIGAFVDGDCRGTGYFVQNDVLFVNVAGQIGDVVTFRLYDSKTGEYTQLAGDVRYGLKAGSISRPVTLSKGGSITSVSEVGSDRKDNVYSVSGCEVEPGSNGIVIIDGKKTLNR